MMLCSFVALLCLLTIISSSNNDCDGRNRYEIQIIKYFGGEAIRESWEIQQLYKVYSPTIYNDHGFITDIPNTNRSTIICLVKNVKYKIILTSSLKAGWGSSSLDKTQLEFRYHNIPFYTLNIPYSSIQQSKTISGVMNTNFYINDSSKWYFSEDIQLPKWYIPSSMDYLLWNQLNTFTPFKTSIHYYIIDINIEDSLAWYTEYVFRYYGNITIYINGEQVFHNEIEQENNQLRNATIESKLASFSIPLRFYLNIVSYIHIAIQVESTILNNNDPFEGFMIIPMEQDVNHILLSSSNTITCSITSSSSFSSSITNKYIINDNCQSLLTNDSEEAYIYNTHTVSIDITFPYSKNQWINQYAIYIPKNILTDNKSNTTNIYSKDSSISSLSYTWTLYGIHQNQQVKLDYKEDILFDSTNTEASFFIFHNRWFFETYRFVIENSKNINIIALQTIQLFITDHIPIDLDIKYSQDIYYPIQYSSLSILPLYASFSEYSIVNSTFPSLNNIYINGNTGSIKVNGTDLGDYLVTIQAYNEIQQIYNQKTIRFIVTLCSPPLYSYIKLNLYSQSSYSYSELYIYESSDFNLTTTENNMNTIQPIFTHKGINYHTERIYQICIPLSLKTIIYKHSDSSHYTQFLQIYAISININKKNNILLQRTCRGKSECKISFYPGYHIYSSASWKSIPFSDSIPSSWNTINFDDSDWPTYIYYENRTLSISSSITLYRHSFQLIHKDLITSLSFQIYTLHGFILYLNGQELKRYRIYDDIELSEELKANEISKNIQFFIITYSSDVLVEGKNTVSIATISNITNRYLDPIITATSISDVLSKEYFYTNKDIYIYRNDDISEFNKFTFFFSLLQLLYHSDYYFINDIASIYIDDVLQDSSSSSSFTTTSKQYITSTSSICPLSSSYIPIPEYTTSPFSLFDMNIYNSWKYPFTTSMDPIEVTILFQSNIYLHMNIMCLTSNPLYDKYNPYDWRLYGLMKINRTTNSTISSSILENNYNEEYLYVSRRDLFQSYSYTKCYYLLNSTKAYDGYRLIFEGQRQIEQSNYISLSEIEFFTMNFKQSILPPLTLPYTHIILPVTTSFPNIFATEGYHNYKLICESCQIIINEQHGYFLDFLLWSFERQNATITAFDTTEQKHSFHFIIESVICSSQYSSLHFYTYFDTSISSLKWSLSYINGKKNESSFANIYEFPLIDKSTIFLTETTQYYGYCLDNGLFSFDIEDSSNNKWSNSFIMLKNIETSFRIFRKDEGKYIHISVNLDYIISHVDFTWKFLEITEYPTNWTSLVYNDRYWRIFYFDDPPWTESHVILLRHTFELTEDDFELFPALSISCYFYSGWVLYINGIPIMLWNMNQDINSLNSQSFSLLSYSDMINSGISIPLKIQNSTDSGSISNTINGAISNIYISPHKYPFILGTNIIAIESHESTIEDMYIPQFDFCLKRLHNHENLMILGDYSSNWNGNNDRGVNSLFDTDIYTSVYVEGKCSGLKYQWTYSNGRRVYINSYKMVNGDDCIHLSPTSWILEGSLDGNIWILLDTVTYVYWTSFNQEYYFSFNNENSYSIYRITIQSCSRSIEDSSCISLGFQLSEWMLTLDTLSYCEDNYGDLTIPYGHFTLFPCLSCEYGYILKQCLGNNEYNILYESCNASLPSSFYYSYEYSLYPTSITNTTQGISPSSPFLFYRYISISPLYPSISICNATYTNITNLPDGLYLNPNTGIITGIPEYTETSVMIPILLTTLNSSSYATLYISITEHYCQAIDEWPLTIPGNVVTILCEDPFLYYGTQIRSCIEDTLSPYWGPIVNNCTYYAPILEYPEIFIGRIGVEYLLPPQIYSGYYTNITFIPSLPDTITFNSTTFDITIISNEYIGQQFLINISNPYIYSLSKLVISIRDMDNLNICHYIDPFPVGLPNMTISVSCEDPLHYKGSLTRTCIFSSSESPKWSNITSTCQPLLPRLLYSSSLNGYTNHYINILTPYIISLPPHILTITPSLPISMTFDRNTGAISGYTTIAIIGYYIVSITDTIGTTEYSLYIHITAPYCETDNIWPETQVGQVAIIPCEDSVHYTGQQSRECRLDVTPYWSIAVDHCLLNPPLISYPSSSLTGYVGQFIQPFIPISSGLNLSDFTIEPILKNGLVFDNKTGIIEGIPFQRDSSLYTISIKNPVGIGKVSIYISITMLTCTKEDDWVYSYENSTLYLWCGDGYIGTMQRTCKSYSNETTYWSDIYKDNCIPITNDQSTNTYYILLPLIIQGISMNSFTIPSVYEHFRAILYHSLSYLIINTKDLYILTISIIREETVFVSPIIQVVIKIITDSTSGTQIMNDIYTNISKNPNYFYQLFNTTDDKIITVYKKNHTSNISDI
ncbi:hypothetical protein WA158_007210 [Blastocystis sp. Blastoise]